jgi:hypothetical protein
MSYIPQLLLANTFGEWLNTINDVIAENNNSTANGTPNTLTRYDANGSLEFNELKVFDLQLKSGPVIQEIRTDFTQNNDTSLCTTKSVYDLVSGATSVIVPVKAKTLTFGTSGLYVNTISTSFGPLDNKTLVTSNAVYNLLNGIRTVPIAFNTDTLQFGTGLVINAIADDFSTIDSNTVATTNAVYNLLTDGAISLNTVFNNLKLGSGPNIDKIVTNFTNTPPDDTSLVTALAVYNLVGGPDNNITTLEGVSLELSSGNKVTDIVHNFMFINNDLLPTTKAVNDRIFNVLTSGTHTINLIANTGNFTESLTADDIHANTANVDVLLIANNINVTNTLSINNLTANYITANVVDMQTMIFDDLVVNNVHTDFSTINDETLVTSNAIYNLITDGDVSINSVFNSTETQTFILNGNTVTNVVSAINNTNINQNTLATTVAIYDLISGNNTTLPSVPLSANTLQFPGGDPNVSINSISTDFSTIDDNTLVTANAVYNLLTDGQIPIDSKFTSLTLENGVTVNGIFDSFTTANINSYSIATTAAIENGLTNGSIAAYFREIEVDNVFCQFISVNNLNYLDSISQNTSSERLQGSIVTPYVYTSAIEAYNEKDATSTGILFGDRGASPAGETISSTTTAIFANGNIQLKIEDGSINAISNPIITTSNVVSDHIDSDYAKINYIVNKATANTLVFPDFGNQELIGNTATQTLTNKTLGKTDISGDIVPTVDSIYSLGSPANKFKDLFLSSATLWIGDNIKLDASSGVVKYLKRDVNAVPFIISSLGGNGPNAIAYVNTTFNYNPAKTTLSELTLNDHLSYLNTFAGYETSDVGTLLPPEVDSNGNNSYYYNINDYDEIIYSETPGKNASEVLTDDLNATIDYHETDNVVFKKPYGDFFLIVNRVSELEGVTVHAKVHVLQNTTPYTLSNIVINGNTVSSMNMSGNLEMQVANTYNTYDIDAVYLDNQWYSTVMVK